MSETNIARTSRLLLCNKKQTKNIRSLHKIMEKIVQK